MITISLQQQKYRRMSGDHVIISKSRACGLEISVYNASALYTPR